MILAAAIGAPAGAQETPINELFARVAPSVVDIATQGTALANRGPATRTTVGGLGSGFLVSEDGKIMTAAHVVQTADKVAVRFLSGEVVEARVISSDPTADVALIQVESVPPGTPVAVLGDSDDVQVGDQVLVVGAPFGFESTLTVGYISGRRTARELFGGLKPVELLQTDAAINQGNSGGPMFNMKGEVIGIVSHILSLSGGFEGLGFVITSKLAGRLLLEEPSIWSGFDGYVLEGDLAKVLNVPQQRAILVQNVAAGSPASTLGLRPGTVRAVIDEQPIVLGGDIILEIQGISLGTAENEQRIRDIITSLPADGRLSLTVLRGGEQMTISKYVYLLE
jgi:S1-C subfamily serine protease